MMPEWQQSFYDSATAGHFNDTPPLFLQTAWLAFYVLSDDAVPLAFLPLEEGRYLRTPAKNIHWETVAGGGSDGSDAIRPVLLDEFSSSIVTTPAQEPITAVETAREP